MTQTELKEMLAAHALWVKSGGAQGARADLAGADLRYAPLCVANLHGADLHGADLQGADLKNADLRYADLTNAILRYADLTNADLCYADLTRANLCYADLCGANLHGADLTNANIDFAALPLWCGPMTPKIDKRIAAQLLYHALRAMQSCADDPDVAAVLASEANLHLANQFLRVNECGKIEPPEGDNK